MNKTTVENLEERFDAGEEVLDYFDLKAAVRPNHRRERINLELPTWMLRRLDLVSGRNGVDRQAQISLWLAERLQAEAGRAS